MNEKAGEGAEEATNMTTRNTTKEVKVNNKWKKEENVETAESQRGMTRTKEGLWLIRRDL
jgi:hypothetical protein